MDNIITPTNARKNLYNLIKKVNLDHTPVTISSSKKEEDAVLISKSDWDAIQETMYLENNGVGDVVRQREKDDSGFTDIDEIDWDKL
ncbi:type II toxin-antitoxin system Phd/YefM family antitoxin [Limosilactobacillus reuteri subsp. suis]|uniref:Antitoxin n=1 Tax=Limosilactobacillus reuteri TaxID=1598 RepID=A0A079YS52_LIMRT|nr:type II toxin-antitoxin system Phd/YefM family antitoxin [Limosilactobacillus reuteri]MDO5008838.1 type II toxin-antitoxin system Phd/YefM family antitoxin [Lactobacillus johnsonii]PEG78731.1 type II toxin-antitoxin system Phd/YefM family antitoxin [Lactobacillus sp. UMNPBX18]KEK15165.1 prevent-host-death protein [Limosilactobacillus reuteri]MCC4399683.1 type II toxin-antitoxin system Phd/YefM family antitoxin [Limosilactobacillus reuteri]MCC4404320.1 type II toxin-antitoxin system Phd/YefM